MNREINETAELFKPADLPADAAGHDIECYVSAMAAKTAYTAHPVLMALRGLGVANTTMASTTGRSKSFITHILAGRRPLPEPMLPPMMVLLAQSVSAARAAVGKAMNSPDFPAEVINDYMGRITEAEKVLNKYRAS